MLYTTIVFQWATWVPDHADIFVVSGISRACNFSCIASAIWHSPLWEVLGPFERLAAVLRWCSHIGPNLWHSKANTTHEPNRSLKCAWNLILVPRLTASAWPNPCINIFVRSVSFSFLRVLSRHLEFGDFRLLSRKILMTQASWRS